MTAAKPQITIGQGQKVDGANCPHCRTWLDGVTPMHRKGKGRSKPKRGDITICIYCAEWCEFTAGGRLVIPSDEKLAEIAKDPTCQVTEAAARKVMFDRRLKGGLARRDAMQGHLLALGAKPQ